MEALYKSIERIKLMPKKPSKKEWNKIAGEEGLLSTITLCTITNMTFAELCSKARRGKLILK